MIISDLQYIESVDASQVTGGRRRGRTRTVTTTAFASGDASIFAAGASESSAIGDVGIFADSNAGESEVFANGSAFARTTTRVRKR